VDIRIYPFYLVAVVLLWILVYHAAFWAVGIIRDSSLVCWSIGLIGITVVSLRQPPLRRILAQLAVGALVLAGTAYASLYLLPTVPIAGLSHTTSTRALAVGLPVLTLSILHLVGVLRGRRHPLWGEARVMSGVQRSLATGARIYFTPAGRAFLRERFDTTPAEFLRMVRY
jgi:hypothetical protein